MPSDINEEERASTVSEINPQPSAPERTRTAPPGYINYAHGGRLEFLTDLEAYQAACIIKKVFGDLAEDEPSPAYALHDLQPLTSRASMSDREIFKTRFLDHLSKLKEYLLRRDKGIFTKYAWSPKTVLLILAAVLIALGGAIAGAATAYQLDGNVVVLLGFIWIIITIQFFYLLYNFIRRKSFLKTLDIALEKVGAFEKLDESVVSDIKRGVDRRVPKRYWKRDSFNSSHA
ncbi:hypothetical protein TWF694_010949 [Orbilia ellipsospora]|uniref:Uncharacterized protein n=1 Tax=Orbilia ellipsospora TaxID=2528407 RepID=A0AAV9X7J5_9PEZI